jgi:hypothetical protein
VAQLEARLSTRLDGGISRSPDQSEIPQRRESFLKRKLSALSPSHLPQPQNADSIATDIQEIFPGHEARYGTLALSKASFDTMVDVLIHWQLFRTSTLVSAQKAH